MSTPTPPTPGMPGRPPTPPAKRRSRTGVVIIVVIIVLIVGGALAHLGDNNSGMTSPNTTIGNTSGVTADEVAAGLMAKTGAKEQFCASVSTLGAGQAEADFAHGYGEANGGPSADDVFASLLTYC